ncbi:MAG: hypothetical protein DRQ48_04305 [Gammaproteobacteria bacterium]|nr:MAG: hypothetical protein DRQ48_04305 [Gammaproteobacteria bacterium]
MTEKQDENIRRGLAEIWRREKLLVASMCTLAIFVIIVSTSTSMVLGKYTQVIVLIIPVIVHIKIWSWVRKTPCPKCGHPYGGHRSQRKCLHCGFELLREKPISYGISFKEIKYQPLEKPRP